MPRNLLTLEALSTDEILALLADAQRIREGRMPDLPDLRGKIACNLFFEPSTRTQYSFCVAQQRLGMRVVSFDPDISSLSKNESFYDTVKTFDSFGVDALVIRHPENNYYEQLLGHVRAPILNGGDGSGSHPTQSLLDLLTIQQEFGRLNGLKVAIIGDIRHSRVAHTNYAVMRRLGMEAITSGPEYLLDDACEAESLDAAIETADVVMMLRIQFERHQSPDLLTAEAFHARYGLTEARARRMKPGAILMHPAPVNRGVELADSLVECPQSRIFKQMENGVFIRMACMHWSQQ
ncbi:MAG: aspartate carbamoyltransferase catalytic subunit [Oscillospiraceae bacterium]|jgi:aspartate carbamoyltransferase catalytic subunit|nr:aspartate carbamoyltransferase catalytic subunit [Oscillospiraceae bacterium]